MEKRPPVHVGGQAWCPDGFTPKNSFHMKWGMPYTPILSLQSVCMKSFDASHNIWSDGNGQPDTFKKDT